jgi:hypothetical protein
MNEIREWNIDGMMLTRKYRSETCPSATFSTTNTLIDLESNPHFMDDEDSLPYLQEPLTGPYPESDKYSPHLPNLFL